MAKIDIGGSKPPANNWIAWAIVLGFSVWLVSRRESQELKPIPDPTRPDAVVLVPPIGIAGSTLIDEWGQENGVEIRRYQEGADLTTAEPWVQQMYQMSNGNRPCAVIALGDEIQIVPIQDDLIEQLEGLR
jgi:hypothetical protein